MQGLFAILFLCYAVLPCLSARITPQANPTYNVVDYGASGNGQDDDSQAFLKAWDAVCNGNEDSPTLFIPKRKTFLLQPMVFQGPCNPSTINIQVQGTIIAPGSVDAWKWQSNSYKETWLKFSNINGLVINGGGLIDGQGGPWWECFAQSKCQRPSALYFHGCGNLQVSSVTQINSPQAHMRVNDCNGSHLSNLHLIAPEDSPNTDGIDISQSSNVFVLHSIIKTGDDCIAINKGSSFVNITDINCGPGHGISVGSLGKNGEYDTVEEVHVKNCTFTGTKNGARIKTWKGGSGYARKIIFEDIILEGAKNPVIIDQNYVAPYARKGQNIAVEVSDITFTNFRGTSAVDEAIQLNCDEVIGCTNLVLDRIKISSSNPGSKIEAICSNAHGTSSSSNVPPVSCLQE